MFRTKRQATAKGMVSIPPAKHQHVILESIQLQADYKNSITGLQEQHSYITN